MPLEVKVLTRVFRFGSVELADPDPKMEVDDVMASYAEIYPDLTAGVVKGPSIEGDKQVYLFSRSIGDKG